MKQRTVSVFVPWLANLCTKFLPLFYAELQLSEFSIPLYNSLYNTFRPQKRGVSNLFNVFMLGFDARNVAVRRGQAQT